MPDYADGCLENACSASSRCARNSEVVIFCPANEPRWWMRLSRPASGSMRQPAIGVPASWMPASGRDKDDVLDGGDGAQSKPRSALSNYGRFHRGARPCWARGRTYASEPKLDADTAVLVG